MVAKANRLIAFVCLSYIAVSQSACADRLVAPSNDPSALRLNEEVAEFLRHRDWRLSMEMQRGEVLAEQDVASNSAGSSSMVVTCTMGSVACAGNEVSRLTYDFMAWGNTQAVNGHNATALSVKGVGYWRVGIGFPMPFTLADTCLGVNSCTDTEMRQHSCSTERNSMGLVTHHTALVNGTLYHRDLSDQADCDDNPGGGGPGSPEEECGTETLVIEIYNPETGLWEYYETIQVEVCA